MIGFGDDEGPIQWTPKLVGARLVEAVRWARYNAGPIGPSGARSSMPAVVMTSEERIEEWGLPDFVDDEELALRDQTIRIAATPEQISSYLAALEWQARFLIPDYAESARVLGIWVRCRVYKRSFDDAIKRRQYLTRTMAYRMRDRALSRISVGLDRAGERP